MAKRTGKTATALANKPEPDSDVFTARQFVDALQKYRSATEREKIKRYFKTDAEDEFIGVKMGNVFALSKKFMRMAPREIEKLLEDRIHEVRTGAVSIMDFQARDRKTPESRRKELFSLYLKRHDRINNWDLVDRSAPYVVGGYLFDKPRTILYKLARSKNIWERRTAVVSTYFFIRKGQVDDTFAIAEMLIHDKEDLIHKAAGSWIREAGKRDIPQLLKFLDRYAGMMPRTMLRYAIEKLSKKQKDYFLDLKNQR